MKSTCNVENVSWSYNNDTERFVKKTEFSDGRIEFFEYIIPPKTIPQNYVPMRAIDE